MLLAVLSALDGVAGVFRYFSYALSYGSSVGLGVCEEMPEAWFTGHCSILPVCPRPDRLRTLQSEFSDQDFSGHMGRREFWP